MIPIILNYLNNHYIENSAILTTSHVDGRINSAIDEHVVIQVLQNQKRCIVYNTRRPRSWHDCVVIYRGKKFFVNVKITDMSAGNADNVSSFLGFMFSLTGEEPVGKGYGRWESRFAILNSRIKETDADYYFFIVDKNNPLNTYVTSLKHLCEINPHGSNLPFQAVWLRNKILIERDFKSAEEFLMGGFKKSLDLRANIYTSFVDNFGTKYDL